MDGTSRRKPVRDTGDGYLGVEGGFTKTPGTAIRFNDFAHVLVCAVQPLAARWA